jgi:hypothetical protein
VKSILAALTSALILFASFALQAEEQAVRADSSLERALERRFGFNSTMIMTLVINTGGMTQTKRMKIRSVWDGDRLCTYAEMIQPAEDRGRKFLSIRGGDGFSFQKVYLPAFRMVRRISLEQKRDPFEGSTLNYEDVETRSGGEYKIVSTGKEIVEGEEASKVTVTPEYKSVYTKTEYLIAKDGAILLLRLFGPSGNGEKLVKTIEAPRKNLEKHVEFFVPTLLLVTDLLTGNKTEVIVSELKINPDGLVVEQVCGEAQLTVSR